MKPRNYLWGAVLVVSVGLSIIGLATGAAILIGLSTGIDLIASIVLGKKKNVE